MLFSRHPFFLQPEEATRTHTSIEGDRRHYLDAAIVRIMKARKELSYEQLKTATVEPLRTGCEAYQTEN